MELPVVLPSELSPLDESLQQLAVDELVTINAKKGRYELTKQGIAYLGNVIDEASDLVDELDELELEEAIGELRVAQPRRVSRALLVGLVRGRVRRSRAVPGASWGVARRAAVGVLPDGRRAVERARTRPRGLISAVA